MKVLCLGCGRANWIGLRHCTRCGHAQAGFPLRRSGGAGLAHRFSTTLQDWTLDGGHLHAAFGDLILVDRSGRTRALTPEAGERPRQLASGEAGGDVEFLAVDRWLVRRTRDRLGALASPLLRTATARNDFPDVQDLVTSMPRGTLLAIREGAGDDGGGRLASMARIGRYLALLVGSAESTVLKVIDLRGLVHERPWEVGARLVLEEPLSSDAWYLDRGATWGGDKLLVCSARELVVLELRSPDETFRVERVRLPDEAGDLRVGQSAIGDCGIVVLTDAANAEQEAWLLKRSLGARPLRARTEVRLRGLELRVERGEVFVVGRSNNTRHRLNHVVPRFESEPIDDSSVDRIEEVLPGGVLYRTNHLETLSFRAPDYEVRVPLREKRDASVHAAVEGGRLWLAADRGRNVCEISMFECAEEE